MAPRSLRAPSATAKKDGAGAVPLPTLFRFLAVVAILGGLAFAGMFALATLIEPTPREMTVTIPGSKLQPNR